MKFQIALAMAVGTVSAASTTNNECWLGEGADYVGKCRDLFYPYCDEYLIWEDDSCNAYTFSISEVQWYSGSLTATYWKYVECNPGTDGGGDDDGFSNFGDFKAKLKQDRMPNNAEIDCCLDSEIPNTYEKSYRMNMIGSTCG